MLIFEQAKKKVNYAESAAEDSDEENRPPASRSRKRLLKRRKTEDSEDDFAQADSPDGGEEVDEGQCHLSFINGPNV